MGTLRLKNYGLYELDELGHDLLVLGIFADERPLRGLPGFVDWRLHGRLSQLLRSGFFEGRSEERLLMPSWGSVAVRRILLLGLGSKHQFTEADLSGFMRRAGEVARSIKAKDLAISVPDWRRADDFFADKVELKLAVVLDTLQPVVAGMITLFLPQEINLKEVSAKLASVAKRIRGGASA